METCCGSSGPGRGDRKFNRDEGDKRDKKRDRKRDVKNFNRDAEDKEDKK
jgi:hypothetical protein